MPFPPTTLSTGGFIQFTFLVGLVYLLAGAPLPGYLVSDSNTTPQSASPVSSIKLSQLEHLIRPEPNLTCVDHHHKGVFVLSREPLVVYIEGFLRDWEARELVHLSEPHFTPSTIWHAGQETLNPSIRRSQKAPLPREETVKCIEERARRFQGWRPHTFIERIWAQKYEEGDHYNYHYDWSIATHDSGRVSSFMVYLQGDCKGGGTHFPRLVKPNGREWCDFIECDVASLNNTTRSSKNSLAEGVIFKPLAGNAIYWENMRSDGTGYPESWHAGLPIESGIKIGLNIWSWFQEGLDL